MVGRVSDGNISVDSVAVTRCSTIGSSGGSVTTAASSRKMMHSKNSRRSWWSRRSSLQRAVMIFGYTIGFFLLGFMAAMLVYYIVIGLPHPGLTKGPVASDALHSSDVTVINKSSPDAPVRFIADTRQKPATIGNDSDVEQSDAICTTAGCVIAATRLLNSIDETVDPCDDFHQYACGKWMDNHIIPDDKSQYGMYEIVAEKLDLSIKRLLESKKPTGIETMEKAKKVYKACMNKDIIDKLGVQPALDFLKATHPWPVIQPELFDESSYDLVEALVNTSRLGKAILIAAFVGTDNKNPTRRVLQIDQPSLGMPSRDYLLRSTNDSSVQAYYEYMASIAAILDYRKTTPPQTNATILAASRIRIERELLDVLNFEIQPANITVPKEQRRDPNRMYNNMTLNELALRVPGFKWFRFMHAMLLDCGIVIDSNEMVIVAEPEYLQRLIVLLGATPKRTIANYVGWRTIQGHIFDLDDSFKESRLRYGAIMSGVSVDPPRWKPCIGAAMEAFDMSVGRLYVETYFDKQSKVLAEDLIATIREAFEQHLDELDWMEPEERVMSREKAGAMIRQIGYSDKIMNNTWLNEYHAGNTGNATDHFGNMVKNARAGVKFWQRKLRQPIDRNEWDVQPATINAFYNPTVNSIMFLAGILQAPYFTRDQPMSLNFGSIGVIMGHEITHGFDDEGRRFDKNGLLRDWWSAKTIAKYLNKTQCVIDLYNNYSVDSIGLSLNGINTQGENIADMGGVQQAYRAYENWLARQQLSSSSSMQQPRLPGLSHLTHEQLFFISGATAWCSIERPERLKQMILTDSHSPEKFRMLGPLSSMPEFARAFNCPINSRMNPEHKCRVW